MIRSANLFLAFVALVGCDRPPKAAGTVARELSPRQRDEFERCKYVYQDQQGLREWLVLRRGWAPTDAAREIAISEAKKARARDSARMYRDSINEAHRAAKDERARRDSLGLLLWRERNSKLLAAERKYDREVSYAKNQPFWGRISIKTYYTNTPKCESVANVYDLRGFRFFQSAAEAERAGFTRTEEAGC